LDPGWKKIKIRDPESGINIPDPKNYEVQGTSVSLWRTAYLFRVDQYTGPGYARIGIDLTLLDPYEEGCISADQRVTHQPNNFKTKVTITYLQLTKKLIKTWQLWLDEPEQNNCLQTFLVL
jgi:hypothetical protein